MSAWSTVTDMPIRKSTKKNGGQIAVETAILLPLFIIGILTLGYLLKFCMISEGVHHALTDEAHRSMADPLTMYMPSLNEPKITERIIKESRGEAKNIDTKAFPFLAFGISKGGETYTDLIAVSVTYDTPIRLPKLFRSEVQGERTVLCRAFTGMTRDGEVKPFDEMEKNDGGGTVWIFPRAGERYHDEHCAYIENNPREILLDPRIRNRYSPCKLCKPADRRDGTLVYCFETSGKAYHIGECTVVDRYVIEISKEDAEKQGYTPCSKCGGGGD